MFFDLFPDMYDLIVNLHYKTLGIRRELFHFSERVEETLKRNDHKGGWEECSLDYLYFKLKEEFNEATTEIKPAMWWKESFEFESAGITRLRKIQNEVRDVAAVCMMIDRNAQLELINRGVEEEEEY